MPPKLLLVDVSSYIFRAFYAVKTGLTSPDGVPTNALFGFKQMLLHLFNAEQPSHVAMVFDTSGGSFRNELYPLYKANRSAPPEELIPQFPLIREFTQLLNLDVLEHDNYEADDLIGSLAQRFGEQIEIKIVSGDKDLTQLVTNKVKMLDTMKDKLYGPAEVKEKFGVGPEMMVEYLALCGDSSDNIPGAAGIGPKTALKLFEKYGNIAGIYKHIDELKGKQKENLIDSKDNVEMSLKLTQIALDMDLEVNLEQLEFKPPQAQPLQEFYSRVGFRPDAFTHSAESATADDEAETDDKGDDWDYSNYRLITENAEWQGLLGELRGCKKISMDFETTSLQAQEAQIVGIAFTAKGVAPSYVPTGHVAENSYQEEGQLSIEKAMEEPATFTLVEQLPLAQVLADLKPIFDDSKVTWVGQNIKYELLVLANYDLELAGPLEDSMIQSYLLDANSHRHNLDELSRLHLGHEMIHYEDLCGKGKKQISFAQVPLDQASDYAAEDADATLQIHDILSPRIVESDLSKLYHEMEMPLVRCLAHMETAGVRLDVDHLAQLNKELSADRDQLEQAIHRSAGREFNVNSPKQLGEILFDEMGIDEAKKKTKTGYSTDASVLEKLAPNHKIASLLLEHRTKTKLINTYLEPLPKLVVEKTGRVHTSFNQVTAATGRLSSKNPNLQNIPIKGEDGRKIRKAFIPAAGCTLVSADYSQIELRFLAHLSQDEGLIEVFQSGGDIHRQTAAAIFAQTLEEVTDDQRRAAKAINFGIIYGMGAFRLANEIGVSNREAKAFIEAYFARYPKIKTYMDASLSMARTLGYVTTIFGRKRIIEGINAKNKMVQQAAERVAINSRIQGSAADLIKIAMIDLDQKFQTLGPANRMILQVHDELIFELEHSKKEELGALIKKSMEEAACLTVPLLVDVGYGSNWGEAH